MEDIITGIRFLMTLVVIVCAILMIVCAAEGFVVGMFSYMIAEAAFAGTLIYERIVELDC